MAATVYNNSPLPLFREPARIHDSTFLGLRSETISKIGLGILVGVCCLPVSAALQSAVVVIMTNYGLDLAGSQDIMGVWDSLNGLSSHLLTTLSKTALFGYIVFLGPLIEEYLFRELLYPWIQSFFQNPESSEAQALCAVANGFVFGLAHLSAEQGWLNVPIFVVTFFLGSVFAHLRGQTGDIVASTAAHSTYNGLVMTAFLLSKS